MRYLILFLVLPILAFGQSGLYKSNLFSATDTVGTIAAADSVEMRFHTGPWKLLTEAVNSSAMITVANKVAEATVIFRLAGEDYWTYTGNMQFRVFSTGTDTITSNVVHCPNLSGAFTLFMVADTVGTNTYYDQSWISGN